MLILPQDFAIGLDGECFSWGWAAIQSPVCRSYILDSLPNEPLQEFEKWKDCLIESIKCDFWGFSWRQINFESIKIVTL